MREGEGNSIERIFDLMYDYNVIPLRDDLSSNFGLTSSKITECSLEALISEQGLTVEQKSSRTEPNKKRNT